MFFCPLAPIFRLGIHEKSIQSGFSPARRVIIMSYIKVWIHLIWSTKNRSAIITKDIKYKLYDHIRENAKKKDIYIDHIDGSIDHIHILISLRGDQNISNIVRLIKGESSRWINSNRIINSKFVWQKEYMALSVSEGVLKRVRNYIRNQESHHRIKSFNDEYASLIKKHGFNKFEAKANNFRDH
jgi:REP element-mobilizing transposase RayT